MSCKEHKDKMCVCASFSARSANFMGELSAIVKDAGEAAEFMSNTLRAMAKSRLPQPERPVVAVGIDPGGTTGVAIFRGAEMVESHAIPGGFEGFLSWWNDNIDGGLLSVADRIVIEDFVVEPDFVGRPEAAEIIGAVKALQPFGAKLTIQGRSAKATLFGQVFTGKRGEAERRAWLEERGLHFFTDHEMDAATHVMVASKRVMAFWRRYWA